MRIKRVKESLSYPTCKDRALEVLPLLTEHNRHSIVPLHASGVAHVIWPDAQWLASQGAGAAASRILKRMEKEGLAKWFANKRGWGWVQLEVQP